MTLASAEMRMEHTDGLGRAAQVWVGGDLLTVCDAISSSDKPCPPGPLEGAKFSYMMGNEGFSWDLAARANPGRKKLLEHTGRFSYVGYGQVVQVMPVVIDFGPAMMEDANWTNDETLVGRFVRVEMDRLEVVPDIEADWPAAAQ